MRKKRTSNALKGIASCMICAWSLCACGNVAEDSSDRKVMEESKAAEYEALFDEIEAITPYKSLQYQSDHDSEIWCRSIRYGL